ncbi:maltokinase N-terminal cap-like domain-containing protein, partial [Streptomyces montanisoli]
DEVRDVSGPLPVAYFVPVTYRSAPLDGASHALIGTCEHGVLGLRHVYDGVHDPVLVEQLYALLRGEAEPQAQSESHTADPTVTCHRVRTPLPAAVPGTAPSAVADGPGGSDVRVPTSDGALTLRVRRVLEPEQDTQDGGLPAGVLGLVTAGWHAPDGADFRGTYASLLDARPDAQDA